MVRFIPLPVSMNATVQHTRSSSSKSLLNTSSTNRSSTSYKAATIVPFPPPSTSSSSSPSTAALAETTSTVDAYLSPIDYTPVVPKPVLSALTNPSVSVPKDRESRVLDILQSSRNLSGLLRQSPLSSPYPLDDETTRAVSVASSITPSPPIPHTATAFRSLSPSRRLLYLAILFGNLLVSLFHVTRLYLVTWLWLVLTDPVWNSITSFTVFTFTLIGLIPRWTNTNVQGIGARTVPPSMYQQLSMTSCSAVTVYEEYWYRIITTVEYMSIGIAIGFILQHCVGIVIKTIQIRKQVHLVAIITFSTTIMYYSMVMSEYTNGICYTMENLIPFTGPVTTKRLWYPLHYVYWFMTTPGILLLTSKLGNLSSFKRAAGVFFQWGFIIAQYGATAWIYSSLIYWIFVGLTLLLFLLTFRILVHSLLQVRILTQDHTTQRVWHILGPLAVCLWCCYPTFWLLASFGLITTDIEGVVWPLMDCLSKCVFAQLWISSDASMDIALDKQLFTIEQQRITADTANQAKRAFMRYIFHELRIPLNSITLGIDEVQETTIDLYGLVNTLQQQAVIGANKDKKENENEEEKENQTDNTRKEMVIPSTSLLTVPSLGTTTEFVQTSQHSLQSLRATLDVIRSNTVSMNNLLDDFFSLEKIEEGKWELDIVMCDVKTMLHDTVRLFHAPLAIKQLTVHVDISSEVPPWFYGDIGKVKQVLNNYLSNAIKYSPTEGSITIQVMMEYTTPKIFRSQPILAKRNLLSMVSSTAKISTVPSETKLIHGSSNRHITSTGHSHDLASYTDKPNVSLVSEDETINIHRLHSLPTNTTNNVPRAESQQTLSLSSSNNIFALPNTYRTRKDIHVYPTLPDRTGCTRIDSSVLPSKTYVPCIRFNVIDNGPGIAKDDQDNLFQPFYQVQRNSLRSATDSTGLGLSICKRIIELSGGKVGVYATEGNGSTFYFSLPLLRKQESNAVGTASKAPSGSHFTPDPVFVPTIVTTPMLPNMYNGKSSVGMFSLGNSTTSNRTLVSSSVGKILSNKTLSNRSLRNSSDKLNPKIITAPLMYPNHRTDAMNIVTVTDFSDDTNFPDNDLSQIGTRTEQGDTLKQKSTSLTGSLKVSSLFSPLMHLFNGNGRTNENLSATFRPAVSSSVLGTQSTAVETQTVSSIPIASSANVPLVLIHQGKDSPTAASVLSLAIQRTSLVPVEPPVTIQRGIGPLHVFGPNEDNEPQVHDNTPSSRNISKNSEQSIPNTTVFVQDITEVLTNGGDHNIPYMLPTNSRNQPMFSRTSYTPTVELSPQSVNAALAYSRQSRSPSRNLYSKVSRVTTTETTILNSEAGGMVDFVTTITDEKKDNVSQHRDKDDNIGSTTLTDSSGKVLNNIENSSSISSPLLTDNMLDNDTITVSSFLNIEGLNVPPNSDDMVTDTASSSTSAVANIDYSTPESISSSTSSSLSSATLPRTMQPLLCCVVVDDVKSNRELFGRMLIRRGVTKIYYAEDGKDAIQMVSKLTPEERSIIQAWFVDNEMPHCDGYECVKQLRLRKFVPDHVPIIGVTGNTFEDERQSFLRAGVEGVLCKPINQQTLQQLLLTQYLTLGNPRRLSINGNNKNDLLVLPLSPHEPAIYSPPIVIQLSKTPVRNWK